MLLSLCGAGSYACIIQYNFPKSDYKKAIENAKDQEANRAKYYKQVELRNCLIAYYESYKELFTEDDYKLVFAKNKNGYYASLENDEVKYEILNGKGKFEGNKYIPSKEGDHIISISVGNAKSYAMITVGEATEKAVESFEKETFKYFYLLGLPKFM